MRMLWGLALTLGMGMTAGVALAQDIGGGAAPGDFAMRCRNLEKLALSGADPLSTEVVPASSVTIVGQKLDIPQYCRVRLTVRPAIRVEIRLPADAAWNGRYFQSGCGGMCGDVLTDYPQLFNSSLPGQARGYATATSDTGHYGSNTDGRWAYNNPQAEEDFGYRSIGETARVAKAAIKAFYPKPQDKSYFAGCSTGGRLAAKAALKYPAEFNGVVSGAPALDYPGLVGTAFAWLLRANTDAQGRAVFNADNTDKATLLYNAMVQQCDKLDGVEDGSIADPRRCAPDLRPLSCGIADGTACLTGEEQRVVELWRQGPRDALGRQLYPGGVPEGSELYWGLWLTGSPAFRASFPQGFARPIAEQFLRYIAFSPDAGPNYQITNFDFNRDPARMTAAAQTLNADDPDLTKFRDAGGKLLMYHGWADPLVTPYKTVEYYEALRGRFGGTAAVDNFLRLFMIPGMDHCGAQAAYGPGVDQRSIDPLTALENWVEKGEAPANLPMTAFNDNGSTAWRRPICPHPRLTVLKDPAADWKDPANWTCK